MDRLCADIDAFLERAPWLAGPTHSLADIAFTPYLIRLELLGLAGFWVDRLNLTNWYARLQARSSTAEVWDWYHADYIGTLRERAVAHREDLAAALAAIRSAA